MASIGIRTSKLLSLCRAQAKTAARRKEFFEQEEIVRSRHQAQAKARFHRDNESMWLGGAVHAQNLPECTYRFTGLRNEGFAPVLVDALEMLALDSHYHNYFEFFEQVAEGKELPDVTLAKLGLSKKDPVESMRFSMPPQSLSALGVIRHSALKYYPNATVEVSYMDGREIALNVSGEDIVYFTNTHIGIPWGYRSEPAETFSPRMTYLCDEVSFILNTRRVA